MGEAETKPGKEKKLDLGNGMSIWFVHLDFLREQDVNSRVLAGEKFERLVQNIARDARLESMPLVTPVVGREQFDIISGHHRTRAARKAGVMWVYVLAFNEPLTRARLRGTQLAHNAINGRDDAQVLAELYASIDDVAEKVASGVTEDDIAAALKQVRVDEVVVEPDYEVLQVVFLASAKRSFDDVVGLLNTPFGVGEVAAEALPHFDNFRAAVRKVSEEANVRNLAGIFLKLGHFARSFIELKELAEKEAPETVVQRIKELFDSTGLPPKKAPKAPKGGGAE